MKQIDVLVIEDEKLLLSAIIKKLELEKVSVVGCPSGTQAWSYLEMQQYLPKVVWLDYYLPDTTGLDFAKKLRGDERWKNIPIVVVSNSASLDKVQQMRSIGVDRFFVKSDHRLEEIVSEVKALL